MKHPIWVLPDKSRFLRQRTIKLKSMGQDAHLLRDDLFDTWETVAAYGIAAPQVGSSLRMFIWKGGAMEGPEVIVNPKIIRAQGELKDYDGCLSVPGIYGRTRRAALVELTGWDESGHSIRRTFQGFDARIIQHEVDHLEGVLFIDRIDDLNDLYVLEEEAQEDGETTSRQAALDDRLLAFVTRERRPIPGHALIW
ncbi:MAG: peptide deformylase [Thermaerobacter sp.]|nr:peptide deformylase [Thermaerobacter sp.]